MQLTDVDAGGQATGLREVRWYSHALQRRMPLLVQLPNGYQRSPGRRFPALYILHGSGHDPTSVLREVRPQDHSDALQSLLLVIPAGDQGWWLDSPIRVRSRYEQYVWELVALMDERYQTLAERSGRGVCGFSMGGFGAMLLVCHAPDAFASASSLLGPLDIAQMFPDYYRLRLLLGTDIATWQRFNPTCLAAALKGTALRFGTAEGAFDRPQNERFAEALRLLGLSFEYYLHPGNHDSAFVRAHIGSDLRFHARILDHTW